MPTPSSVVLSRLTFAWPDGTVALHDLTATFGPGRTGLVGRNGAGKSTLLRVLAGELRPTSGSVVVTGGGPSGHADVGYLPQSLGFGAAPALVAPAPRAAGRAAAGPASSTPATPATPTSTPSSTPATPSSTPATPSSTPTSTPAATVPATGGSVADLLGVGARLRALRAIESGTVPADDLPDLFETLADDWDVETRAAAAVRTAGLAAADLDRPAATLSGGETILVALAGLGLASTPVTLLDEPTNNLDRDARDRLYAMVGSWRGTLVVVSHDRTLLDLMDATAELHDGSLDVFGGTFTAYEDYLGTQQEAAARAVRTAEQRLRTEKRERVDAERRIARSARAGRKAAENMPKILANSRKNAAEATAGKTRADADERLERARAAVDEAESRVRDDDHIRVDLPGTEVPTGRRLLELDGADGRPVVLQGPERVALGGPNGAGKTTLLESLLATVGTGVGAGAAGAGAAGAAVGVGAGAGAAGAGSGEGSVAGPGAGPGERPRGAAGRLLTDRVGYLAQRLTLPDDDASVLDTVRSGSPELSPGEVRNRLARFLLRGSTVDRPVRTLSGGERFRVALARVLLADPPPQLLVLDEPTNNLDLASVDQLAEALDGYRGALLVVSHDAAFLERIGAGVEVGTRWVVERGRGVRVDG